MNDRYLFFLVKIFWFGLVSLAGGEVGPGLHFCYSLACPGYYRPQTKLREGNVFTPVCDSVHRGGVSVWGGLCREGSLSGGLYPGGLCLGGLCPVSRGSLYGGVSVRRHPPYGKERTVRILLECILVLVK